LIFLALSQKRLPHSFLIFERVGISKCFPREILELSTRGAAGKKIHEFMASGAHALKTTKRGAAAVVLL